MSSITPDSGLKREPASGRVERDGPITRITDGGGPWPWLPRLVLDPGVAYVVTPLMTATTPAGTPQRVCRWCVLDVLHAHRGHVDVDWERTRPQRDARCRRCGHPFEEAE